VLVRNKPEEAVLLTCKTFSSSGASTTTDTSCVQDCSGLSCDDYSGS
jgi:hypothetical protein